MDGEKTAPVNLPQKKGVTALSATPPWKYIDTSFCPYMLNGDGRQDWLHTKTRLIGNAMALLIFVCVALPIALLITGCILGQESQADPRHLMGHNQLGMPIYAPPPLSPLYSPRQAEWSEPFGAGCFCVVFAGVAYWLSGYWEITALRWIAFLGSSALLLTGLVGLILSWREYCLSCEANYSRPAGGKGVHILLFMIILVLAITGAAWGIWSGHRFWPQAREPVFSLPPPSISSEPTQRFWQKNCKRKTAIRPVLCRLGETSDGHFG